MDADDTRTRTVTPSDDSEQVNPTQKIRLQERLDVSDAVVTRAIELYQQVQGIDVRGRRARTLPVAVLYIAIRQQSVARNIEEVAAAADVSPPELYRTARTVCDELDQGIPPAEPELYVGRLADETGLSAATEEVALRILSAAKSAGYHVGRNPEGMAAAALYAALVESTDDPPVTQRDLGDATSVSPETIRRNYQQMHELHVQD